MNFAKVDVESGVMSGVTKMDKDLASQIQDRMTTFDNMADIDNRSMQTLLRSIENDLLMSADISKSFSILRKSVCILLLSISAILSNVVIRSCI